MAGTQRGPAGQSEGELTAHPAEALKGHSARRNEERLRLGSLCEDRGLVFPNPAVKLSRVKALKDSADSDGPTVLLEATVGGRVPLLVRDQRAGIEAEISGVRLGDVYRGRLIRPQPGNSESSLSANTGGFWLFFITIFYQKLCLMVTFASIFFFAANDVLPWVQTVSAPPLFALLVSSISALVFVNFGIYLGRRYEFLDLTVDFVPFRPLYRRLKARTR